VVCRHSLKLDLDVSLHGSAKGAALLAFSVDVDLVLDVLDILFSTDPCWSSSEMWEIFGINIILFTVSKDIELITVWN
jgi:hypothetical protein